MDPLAYLPLVHLQISVEESFFVFILLRFFPTMMPPVSPRQLITLACFNAAMVAVGVALVPSFRTPNYYKTQQAAVPWAVVFIAGTAWGLSKPNP